MTPTHAIDLAEEADFALAGLSVSPASRQVRYEGRSETLEPRVMQVLVALSARRGDVVSRDALIRQCWEGRIVGDDAINRCISRLRRLGKHTGQFAIEAIAKVGYRLQETGGDPTVAAPPRPWRRPIRIAVLGLLLAAVAGTVAYGILQRVQHRADRVAVLPLKGLSEDPSVRLFGEAVAGQIVAVLAENQVPAVTRDDIAALRGDDRTAAADRLGAALVLDGTVQKGPQGLHVVVRLDRASSHVTVWTASIDQGAADPVSLQSQIAAKIVDEVKAALRATRQGEIVDEALSAYLKAEEYARIGGREAKLQRRDLMRVVVANAPAFSRGFSGLALSSAQLLAFTDDQAPLRAEAKRTADRALALDPDNGEAYLALALLAPATDLAGQEAQYRRGLTIDPDEPTLNSNLAYLLSDLGRSSEANTYYQRSVSLDPLSPRKTASLSGSLVVENRPTEARAVVERALKLWPNNSELLGTHLYIVGFYGHPDEGIRMLARLQDSYEPVVIAILRDTLIARQEPTAAHRQAAVAKLRELTTIRQFGWTARIELLAGLRDIDGAYAMIDRYLDTDPRTARVRPDTAVLFRPTTADLRADPRFEAVLRRTGLFAYWAKRRDLPDFCASERVPVCTALRRAQAGH